MTMRAAQFPIIAVAALALSACLQKTARPHIAYDPASFKPAVREPGPDKPVQVVQVPQPLPLPGQLKPPPGKPAHAKRSPEAEVKAANRAATREPTSHGYINAIQVYPFSAGALYRLYAAPEEVSDIALQPGETLTAISAGDTVRWVVGDTTSGTGSDKRVHVLVKPFAPGLKTNLVITTNRRAYHLELRSTPKTYIAAVSWTYPADSFITLNQRNDASEAAAPVASGVALGNLHFRYAIGGDSPPWRPVRAFDDGHKVYIEFPARIDQGEAPPLFVVGPRGGSQLVNYRVHGNYYIVDRLFAAAELRLGQDPQQVVRISRTDAIRTAHDRLASGAPAS